MSPGTRTPREWVTVISVPGEQPPFRELRLFALSTQASVSCETAGDRREARRRHVDGPRLLRASYAFVRRKSVVRDRERHLSRDR